MSSLTTTTINTINGTTDLTMMTGNSSASAIVLATDGTMKLKANSTLDAVSISATSITTNTATFTSNGNFTASGNVAGVNIAASANVTTVNITASGTVNADIINVASNTLNLGTSTNTANGYTYLPNGLKMNWGSMVVNTTSNATFSSAFTTNAYSVTVTPITASIYISANTINVLAVNAQAAQIRSLSTTTTARAYFIAIGI